MRIPHTALSTEALQNLLAEFVSREGTDYGREYSLEDKVMQVLRQLESGTAVLLYDPASGSCHIEARERLAVHEPDLASEREQQQHPWREEQQEP